MKKKILIGFAALAITALAALNVNFNLQKSELLGMSLANVEALAVEFKWDGKTWNDTDEHSVGSKWMPVKTTCKTQIGMAPYIVIVDGHKVTCNNGNGNCLVASSCTNA